MALSLVLVLGGLFELWAIDGLGLSTSAKAGMSGGLVVVGACVTLRRTSPFPPRSRLWHAGRRRTRLDRQRRVGDRCRRDRRVRRRSACGPRGALVVLAGGLVFGLLVGFLEGVEGIWNFLGNYAFVATLMIGVPWAGGRAIRARHELSPADAEHAAAAERLRIARELHDIVGQALGVIVVQAEGERATLPPEATSTRETLATIAQTAREALDDVRRLLLVMREDERRLGPQPGLVDLPRLMESVEAVGLPCELVVEGTSAAVLGDRPLAYRVVQESLTNTLRHAGAAQAGNHPLRTEAIDIEVLDDGRTDLRVTISRLRAVGHARARGASTAARSRQDPGPGAASPWPSPAHRGEGSRCPFACWWLTTKPSCEPGSPS